MSVLFYKTICSEVNKRFSELYSEEKHKNIQVIAPQSSNINTVTEGYKNIAAKKKRARRRT